MRKTILNDYTPSVSVQRKQTIITNVLLATLTGIFLLACMHGDHEVLTH